MFELDGISGAGTESMYAAAGDENQIQSPKNSSSTIVHPMALLSDKYEKLTVDGLETFFVWASHYSPKRYNVTAGKYWIYVHYYSIQNECILVRNGRCRTGICRGTTTKCSRGCKSTGVCQTWSGREKRITQASFSLANDINNNE